MLNKWTMRLGPKCQILANRTLDRTEYCGIAQHVEWVLATDAEALQMRVIELEQKLKTQDELKAEFELDCAADCDCKR